jgi:hypothetical protein
MAAGTQRPQGDSALAERFCRLFLLPQTRQPNVERHAARFASAVSAGASRRPYYEFLIAPDMDVATGDGELSADQVHYPRTSTPRHKSAEIGHSHDRVSTIIGKTKHWSAHAVNDA